MLTVMLTQPRTAFRVNRLARGSDLVRGRRQIFDAVFHAQQAVRFSNKPILAHAQIFGLLAVGRCGIAPNGLGPMIRRGVEPEELDDVVNDLFRIRDHVFEEHDLEILGGEEREISLDLLVVIARVEICAISRPVEPLPVGRLLKPLGPMLSPNIIRRTHALHAVQIRLECVLERKRLTGLASGGVVIPVGVSTLDRVSDDDEEFGVGVDGVDAFGNEGEIEISVLGLADDPLTLPMGADSNLKRNTRE